MIFSFTFDFALKCLACLILLAYVILMAVVFGIVALIVINVLKRKKKEKLSQ